MSPLAACLESQDEGQVALVDVRVAAVCADQFLEVEVTQFYRNDENQPIEAVYSFPLPLDAVLLELEVALGERRLTGTVVARATAEAAYEDAIEDGHAAFMLEVAESGLYTLNVGNLLPGELARITFRYALLQRWSGDHLRILLPTTVAPRYGVSPLQQHQQPQSCLAVENRFELELEIRGELRHGSFECPSHAVTVRHGESATFLALGAQGALMDRDFVLDITAPEAPRSVVLLGRDGADVSAIASFRPRFPGLRTPHPLTLAVVVDCSGSMAGDSIAQARRALDGILQQLRPDDRLALVAFGSTTRSLAPRLLPCTRRNLAAARAFTGALDADLGGTEMGAALHAAYQLLDGSAPADLLLITDGAFAEWSALVGDAQRAGHRVFTVGVGSAVGEACVRELAERTGGACELVAPREGMAERIVRHFERLRAPRARSATVHWPEGSTALHPARLGAVFEGDTVIASAVLGASFEGGAVRLEIETAQGERFEQSIALSGPVASGADDGISTIARCAAATGLADGDAAAGAATALRYRLLSPWSNWLVVAKRETGAQAAGVPALRKVPQMLAAGWGALGSVLTVECRSAAYDRAYARPPSCESSDFMDASADWEGPRDRRLRLLRSIDAWPAAGASASASADEPPAWCDQLVALVNATPGSISLEGARDLLQGTELWQTLDDLLQRAKAANLDDSFVAALILSRLLRGDLHDELSAQAQAAAEILADTVARLERRLLRLGRLAGALADTTHAQPGDRLLADDSWVSSAAALAAAPALLAAVDSELQARMTRVAALPA